jgi:hypothetical protein
MNLETTECDKLKAAGADMRIIQNFLDWLRDKKAIHLAKYDIVPIDDTLYEVYESNQQLIYEYFKIDSRQLDAERVALLYTEGRPHVH